MFFTSSTPVSVARSGDDEFPAIAVMSTDFAVTLFSFPLNPSADSTVILKIESWLCAGSIYAFSVHSMTFRHHEAKFLINREQD